MSPVSHYLLLFLFKSCQTHLIPVPIPVRTVLVKRLRPKNVRKRKVTIPGPSPPHCGTPDGNNADSPRAEANPADAPHPPLPLVEVDEPIVMLDGGPDPDGDQDDDDNDDEGQMQMMNPLEAFMGPDGFALPPGMDLQSDAEDEAMVELAIALSLQEQAGGAAMAIQGIQEGLQALEDMHQEVLHAEALSPPEDDGDVAMRGNDQGGAESDATASQNSDDEGSTVATEGSTMRNSEPVRNFSAFLELWRILEPFKLIYGTYSFTREVLAVPEVPMRKEPHKIGVESWVLPHPHRNPAWVSRPSCLYQDSSQEEVRLGVRL